MAKAKITATELASHMGLKKGHGKTLEASLRRREGRRDRLRPAGAGRVPGGKAGASTDRCLAAASGITEPDDMMTGLPLQVRYFCMVAKEGRSLDVVRGPSFGPPHLRRR